MTLEHSLPTTPHPRFISAELRPFADDETLIIAPTGEMFQVDVPPDLVGQVLRHCDGRRSLEEIVADTPDPDEFTEILSILAEVNAISFEPPQVNERDWSRFPQKAAQPDRLRATQALLLGDERLLTLVQKWELTERFASTQIVSLESLEGNLDQYPAEDVVILALRDHLDVDFLTQLDRFCEAAGLRWSQFHLEQGVGWLGPIILPGQTANYHDLLVRRQTAAENVDQEAALLAMPVAANSTTDQLYLPPEHELLWMLTTFFIEIERWLADAPCRMISVEVEADPRPMALKSYPILPLPDHQLNGALQISAPTDASLLLNERSGIVIRVAEVEHHPAVPATLKTMQTHVADMSRYSPTWHNDSFSAGSVFGPVEIARRAAIGEAVERYCANYIAATNLTYTSYNQLVDQGDYALDPEHLTLFSEKMYNTPGCPFIPFTHETVTYWIKGRSLTKDRPAWLPATLIYVNWDVAHFPDTPPIHSPYYPGVAAGEDLAGALVSAIQELVERDITMVWWLNHQPLPAVALPPELQALWQGQPADLGQRAWAIYLPNEFKLPVIAGVVENTKEDFLNIGFACRPDPSEAILKAWTEALTLQEGSRDIDDPQGLTRQSIEWGWLSANALKPWRADRAYLDDYRPDFRDVTHLMGQQQIFLDPRAVEQVRPWVNVPETVPITDLPSLSLPTDSQGKLAIYQALLESKGYEVFYADLTTPDIHHTGLRAVRVIVPGLTPNFPAAYPPTGGGRAQNLAVRLGWRDTPLAEEALNYMPMPHA